MKTAPCELWLLTGSQHLYGPQTLALSPSAAGPGEALGEKHFTRKHGAAAYYGQPVPTTPEEIRRHLLRTPAPAPSRSASPAQS